MSRISQPLLQVAKSISDRGQKAISVAGDVTDPSFPAKLIAAAVDKFQGLHILINNAGAPADLVLSLPRSGKPDA